MNELDMPATQKFTIGEWAVIITFLLIIAGIATLVFNVFGFVIGVALVIGATIWLSKK